MADSVSPSNEGISFNITIDDTSPVYTYIPPVNNGTSSASSWIACYSAFGASICDGDDPSNGISLHATSVDGALLRFEWIGE